MNSGRMQRLFMEFQAIEDYCANNKNISSVIQKKLLGTNIPEIYDITFNIKSFIGIRNDNSPIIGNKHIIRIDLSGNYPTFPAKITALTPIWHPNIKFDGPGNGHICANQSGIGNESMTNLILRLEDIVSYKNYWAINEEPYPEDLEVALWVRNHGEPKGYIEKLLEEAETSIFSGEVDEEQLIIDFVYKALNIGAEPVGVEIEDIDPGHLVKSFLEQHKGQQSKEISDLIQIVIKTIEILKNEGKLFCFL